MEGQQRHILQRLLPLVALAIFALALWVLVREIRTISVSDIVAEFRSLSTTVLFASGLLAAASYGVLTLYDYLALHYVGAGLKYRRVAPIAFSAFAVGHNVGLASLSGGAIRYRAYSLAGLTTSQIALVIAFLPLTYDLGAALLIGVTRLLEPAAVAGLPLHRTLIEVIAEPEAVSTVATDDPRELARAAYHLGNRHVPLQVGPGWVRYGADHVLDAMLLGLGLKPTAATEPFEPEAGAYTHGHEQAGHGHHHG